MDQDIDFLGLSEPEARQAAEARGMRFRVRKRNGKSLMGTADFDRNRVNVETEDGRVVRVLSRG